MAAVVTAALLVALGCAAAEEPRPIKDVDNSFSASYLKSHLHYQEPGNVNGANDFDDEYGYTQGGRVALSWMGHLDVDNVYVFTDWQGTEGAVNYTGYFQGGGPVSGGKSRATINELNFRVGKGFELGPHWMLTPFFGSGNRHWVRELGLGTTGDFNEAYNFWYWAFGGMVQYSPSDRVVMTLDASFGKTAHPTITVSENVAPGFCAACLFGAGLGEKPIQRYGLDFDCRVWKGLHTFAGGNLEYYKFGASAPSISGAFEPFSRTSVFEWTTGARLSFSGWNSD